ncbi:MAG: hypothetical protein FWF82_02565, partial [Oscillospiraceae bacterium]|nr:hypothetical protein [Oscillospiraceae bacterium]
MKKLLSFICIAGVLCALVACTESDTTNPANQNEANITENQQQENTPKEPEKPYYRKDCCTPQYDSGNMVMREVYEVVDTKNLRDDYFEEQINTIEGFLKYHTPDYTNDKVTVFKDGKEMTSGGFEVGMVVRLYHGDEFCGDYTIKKVMRYPPEIPFTEEDIPEGGFEPAKFVFDKKVETFLADIATAKTANGDKYGYRTVVMQNGKEVTSGTIEQDMSYLLYQGDELYEEYPFIEVFPELFIDTTNQQQENTPKEPEKPYYRKDCCTPQYDSGNMVMREVYEVVD